MKKQRLLVLLLAIVFILSCGVLAACQPEESPLSVYTVTFSGAPGVATLNVTHGQKATKPADPTRSGYTFEGWYLDAECTQAFDFATVVIEQSIVLYAKWKEVDQPPVIVYYTVSFNTHGGTPATIAAQQVVAGTSPVLPTVSRPGYVFDGWFTDAEYTTANRFINGMPVSANITLHAKWRENTGDIVKYSFKFVTNGGGTIAAQEILPGATATKPNDPTRTGYDFAGWYADSSFITPYVFTTPVAGDTTVYAKWTPAAFSITWDSLYYQGLNQYEIIKYLGVDANTAAANITAEPNGDGVITIVNGDYLIFALALNSIDTAKVHAVLVNGSQVNAATDAALTMAKAKLGDSASYTYYCVQITKDTVIRVVWTQFVTFTLDGGIISGNASDVKVAIIDGKVKLPSNPTKATCDFKGWFIGSTEFVNENIVLVEPTTPGGTYVGPTVTAKWATKTYTVTVANNAGSQVTVEMGKLLEGSDHIGDPATSLTVEHSGKVGLRVRDMRTGNNLPPITVRINGKLVAGQGFMIDAPQTQGTGLEQKDRTFTIKIEAKTDIVVSAEHTQIVAIDFSEGLNQHIIRIGSTSGFSTSGVNWAFNVSTCIPTLKLPFNSGYEIGYGVKYVNANRYAAKETVVFYIDVEPGYEPSAATGITLSGGSISFKKTNTGNVWEVTYTLPSTLTKSTPYTDDGSLGNKDSVVDCEALDDSEFIMLSSFIAIATKTTNYTVNGLNVTSSGKWALIQVQQKAVTGVWTQYTGTYLTQFNVLAYSDPATNYSIALVSLDGGFYKAMRGNSTFIDGTVDTEDTIRIGNVEYKMWLKKVGGSDKLKLSDVVGSLANVTFTVDEYIKVTTKTNLKVTGITYIKLGNEHKFTADTTKYQVMINGVIFEGTGAGATKSFVYQANAPIVVELLQRYEYYYSLGNSAIALTDTTIRALYGETVSFKAVGTKAGSIITVKVGNMYISGSKSGEYSFIAGVDKLEPIDFVETQITVNFDDAYVTVLNGTDEIYIPIAALGVSDGAGYVQALGLPVRANYIFRGLQLVKTAIGGAAPAGTLITPLDEFNGKMAYKDATSPLAAIVSGETYKVVWQEAKAMVTLYNAMDDEYFKLNEVFAGPTSLYQQSVGGAWYTILDNLLIDHTGAPLTNEEGIALGAGGIYFFYDTVLTISIATINSSLPAELAGKKPVLKANGKVVPYANGAFTFRVGDYCDPNFDGQATHVAEFPTLKLELFFNSPIGDFVWDGTGAPELDLTIPGFEVKSQGAGANETNNIYVYAIEDLLDTVLLIQGMYNEEWNYYFSAQYGNDLSTLFNSAWTQTALLHDDINYAGADILINFRAGVPGGSPSVNYEVYWLTISDGTNTIHLVFIVHSTAFDVTAAPNFTVPSLQ